MSDGTNAKIRVVYEGGVFKPLQEINLCEGTKAFVVLKPGRITSVARRRIKKELVPKICEEIFAELVFVNTSRIFEEALSIARETGSRADDSFYIACAKGEEAILISNNKYQNQRTSESICRRGPSVSRRKNLGFSFPLTRTLV